MDKSIKKILSIGAATTLLCSLNSGYAADVDASTATSGQMVTAGAVAGAAALGLGALALFNHHSSSNSNNPKPTAPFSWGKTTASSAGAVNKIATGTTTSSAKIVNGKIVGNSNQAAFALATTTYSDSATPDHPNGVFTWNGTSWQSALPNMNILNLAITPDARFAYALTSVNSAVTVYCTQLGSPSWNPISFTAPVTSSDTINAIATDAFENAYLAINNPSGGIVATYNGCQYVNQTTPTSSGMTNPLAIATSTSTSTSQVYVFGRVNQLNQYDVQQLQNSEGQLSLSSLGLPSGYSLPSQSSTTLSPNDFAVSYDGSILIRLLGSDNNNHLVVGVPPTPKSKAAGKKANDAWTWKQVDFGLGTSVDAIGFDPGSYYLYAAVTDTATSTQQSYNCNTHAGDSCVTPYGQAGTNWTPIHNSPGGITSFNFASGQTPLGTYVDSAFAIAPSSSSAQQSSIYYTSAGAVEGWTSIANTFLNNQTITSFAGTSFVGEYAPIGIMFASTKTKMFMGYVADPVNSWEDITATMNNMQVLQPPVFIGNNNATSRTAYIMTASGIYASPDQGQTWTAIPISTLTSYNEVPIVAASNRVYFSNCSFYSDSSTQNPSCYLYSAADATTAKTETLPDNLKAPIALAASANPNSNTVYAGGGDLSATSGGGVLYSSTGDGTWVSTKFQESLDDPDLVGDVETDYVNDSDVAIVLTGASQSPVPQASYISYDLSSTKPSWVTLPWPTDSTVTRITVDTGDTATGHRFYTGAIDNSTGKCSTSYYYLDASKKTATPVWTEVQTQAPAAGIGEIIVNPYTGAKYAETCPQSTGSDAPAGMGLFAVGDDGSFTTITGGLENTFVMDFDFTPQYTIVTTMNFDQYGLANFTGAYEIAANDTKGTSLDSSHAALSPMMYLSTEELAGGLWKLWGVTLGGGIYVGGWSTSVASGLMLGSHVNRHSHAHSHFNYQAALKKLCQQKNVSSKLMQSCNALKAKEVTTKH